MDERLVTGKEAMTAGKEIPLEPPLAHVLAQHLHHAAIRRNMLVGFKNLACERSPGSLEAGAQAVGFRFIRAKHPEVPAVSAEFKYVTQKSPHHSGGFAH